MQERHEETEDVLSLQVPSYLDTAFDEMVEDILLPDPREETSQKDLDMEFWSYVSREITDFVLGAGYDERLRERLLRDGAMVLKKGNSLELEIDDQKKYVKSKDEYYGRQRKHVISLEII